MFLPGNELLAFAIVAKNNIVIGKYLVSVVANDRDRLNALHHRKDPGSARTPMPLVPYSLLTHRHCSGVT